MRRLPFSALVGFAMILAGCTAREDRPAVKNEVPTQPELTPDDPEAVAALEALQPTMPRNDAGQVIAVDFTNRNVANDDLVHLAGLPALRKLTLYGPTIDDGAIEYIVPLENLDELLFEKTQITDDSLERIAQGMPQLVTLAVSRCGLLTKEAFPPLAGLTKLQRLYLVGSPIDATSVEPIAQIEGLRLLDLRNCQYIDNEALAQLVSLKNLERLKLGSPYVTDEGMQHLLAFPKLKGLWLDNARVTDTGMETVGQLSGLEELYLMNVGIGDTGLAALAGLTGLKRLDLRSTQVRGSGLAALKNMDRLAILNLSETRLNDEGLAHLAGLTSLEELHLWNTRVTDEGIGHLTGLENLRVLDLSGTSVGDAALETIGRLPALETLVLQDTAVSDEGLAHLQGLSHLKSLNLRYSYVTAEGAEELAAALPQAEIKQ